MLDFTIIPDYYLGTDMFKCSDSPFICITTKKAGVGGMGKVDHVGEAVSSAGPLQQKRTGILPQVRRYLCSNIQDRG